MCACGAGPYRRGMQTSGSTRRRLLGRLGETQLAAAGSSGWIPAFASGGTFGMVDSPAAPQRLAAVMVGTPSRIVRQRRALQIALGLLWLLDAALQYQPFMFGGGFVSRVIEPAARGNPGFVARPELWAAHAIAANPPVWNALFATVQLAFALGLFWPRTVKLALAATVAWSLGVWWFGEGLGGVLTGAGPIAGAPGPAVLYALLALLLWHDDRGGASVASSGLLGRAAVASWVVLWTSEAFLALLPSNDSGSFGRTLGIVLAAAAVAVLLPPKLCRPLLALAIALAGLLWFDQNFGDVLTGHATDPNSGPLLALLAFAYWPLGGAAQSEPSRRC